MVFLVGFSDVCLMYWERLGRLSGVFGVSFCCIVSALVFVCMCKSLRRHPKGFGCVFLVLCLVCMYIGKKYL